LLNDCILMKPSFSDVVSGGRSTVAGLMDQPTLSPELGPEKAFARDLADGDQVESVFVVREVTRRQKRNGDPFLKLQLGDVTGTVEGVIWDDVEDALEAGPTGAVVHVSGGYSVDARYGATLTVRSVRPAETGEYDPQDLLEGPQVAYAQLVADLEELIGTVQSRPLRDLLESLLCSDSELAKSWRTAPAAKYYHQAYRHGLLEHCLSVAQGVSAVSATFPAIDRDIAVTGALLHDIGKVEAYAEENGAIEMTDAGKLESEIPLGYYRVRRAIEDLDGFPPDTAQAVLHIILSHHGQLEHGSPVVPCTREATLVHMIDNLGGRLGSFDRIEKNLADGERWSAFDRALSGSAYFGARADAEAEAA
jgi:3'-5' exoribonuclease